MTVSNDTNHIKIVLPFLRVATLQPLDDGFFDVLIGRSAVAASINYLVLGAAALPALQTVQFSDFLSPSVSYDFSGRSVSNAGDINGDGFDDLIIGVPYAARCYVMFGTEEGFVNMTEGFTIFGAQSSDLTGWSVSGAGDVNNDTYADIIIGAPRGGGSAGVSYVLFGKHSGFADINLESLEAVQGFAISGAASGDCSGLSVSGAGKSHFFVE